MITRIQGIVTQVILDHALRIRLKADVPESRDKKDATAASTPDTISIVDEGETSTLAEDHRSSDGDDRSTTAASGSASAPTKDSGSIKDVGTKPSEKKEGNMIGKINNLVTTDLSTFEGGQNFLLLCKPYNFSSEYLDLISGHPSVFHSFPNRSQCHLLICYTRVEVSRYDRFRLHPIEVILASWLV